MNFIIRGLHHVKRTNCCTMYINCIHYFWVHKAPPTITHTITVYSSADSCDYYLLIFIHNLFADGFIQVNALTMPKTVAILNHRFKSRGI